MRILLIEDDYMIGEGLRQALTRDGMTVDWMTDGLQAQEALRQGYDLVVLDLGLPGRDGLEILRQARRDGSTLPVLVLTARDGIDDRVAGLDVGADDYLTKPFDLRELQARLRAILRRRGGHAQSRIGTAALKLDLASRELIDDTGAHALTAREFALLHALLERPGAILSRNQLEERIYGWKDEVNSNAVEVLIHGLRRRFGNALILNVRGLGWRVAPG
ncbi:MULTISPECIES: response regulator transcription factor [Hydrocarboniphaga]|jgi:DNA-binding response OmpR family regulator|uniref:Two component transcriptional regulator winged helix family n=1 Tax=Hydrocarboniphaga effusa AP103 TaxID=1172194 RepID=I8T1Z7_9GAMM|nr:MULTISPECIES: response regulator transcription factor [Hydrocarboniphaga]EIT67940.1 two component transcriptional regulator winged helix family [Hydrocarboniphaga effusa AP103]MDZ4076998.1 response regulator transcription factor [Hydrocarboniphaga sp.]